MEIEIPFGAKDSELKEWKYTIPEGYTAEIKDGEIIVKSTESEDERIRKELINFILYRAGRVLLDKETEHRFVAYLDRQKAKERLDRMAPIYNDKESFESALEKAWKYYNESASRTVDSFEDDYIECVFSKGFREGFLYGEKQKEQKPIKVYDNMDDLIADAMIEETKESDMPDCFKYNRIFWINKHRQNPELPKPHKGDDTNPYDMSVSKAQEYAINRGFGIPFNDGEVYVDERHITQTIGNILRWADEHPKK